MIFPVEVVLRFGHVEPFDPEEPHNNVLDVRGSMDCGSGLFFVVPTPVVVKVQTSEVQDLLFRSKRSIGEQALVRALRIQKAVLASDDADDADD